MFKNCLNEIIEDIYKCIKEDNNYSKFYKEDFNNIADEILNEDDFWDTLNNIIMKKLNNYNKRKQMFVESILLEDSDEGLFNLIIFNKKVDFEEVKHIITKVKVSQFGEWNIDSITTELKKIYDIKEVKLFESGLGNNIDIIKDC